LFGKGNEWFMLVSDVIAELERLSPVDAACQWDNVGLMVGDRGAVVRKILVTLDVDDAAVECAVKQGADLVISHHPLIFGKLSVVTTDTLAGERIIKMIKHGINCYSMHTNFDICGSMGDIAARVLGLENASTLEVTRPDGNGLGKVADVSALGLDAGQWCRQVKERFGVPNVKVFGRLDRQVDKLAIYPGSGRDAIGLCIRGGVDVLVTGDIGHHAGIDAAAQGLTVIDAGHYGIEHVFIPFMTCFLKDKLGDAEVQGMSIVQPFVVV
jgi:dinuclear metal center YbgI/SA1388 family protein